MKKLNFLTLLLIILMFLPACQKENIIEDQITLTPTDQEIAQLRRPMRPFHASFISTQISFGPNEEVCGAPAPFFYFTQSLSGNATHLGNISGTTSFCILAGTGGVTFVAANGDELNMELFEGNDTLFIDGGTGRFDDATGWVTSEFEQIGVNPLMFSNEMDGEIQY